MNQALLVPIALVPTPTPERREVARKVAGMTLGVALLGVIVVTTLALIVMRRMRRRVVDSDRARRTRHSDAWAEAGRRAGSPPAEAFEPDQPSLPDPEAGAGPGSQPRPPGDPHG